jgi:thioredoxin 2
MAKLTCLACGQANRVPAARLGAGPKCGTCGEALLDGRVRAIDPAVLDKAIRTDEVPLVVDFWAPWCGPCRMMAPELGKAAARLAPAVRVAKIDTEAHPGLGARFGIRGIPLLIAFAGGRERARQAGAQPSAGIEAWARGAAATPA